MRQNKIDTLRNNGRWNYVPQCTNRGETWSDDIEMSNEDTIRVVSKNIGELKVICGNEKENELKNWIVEN